MAMTQVALASMRRRSAEEFIATMEARGASGVSPSSFAGQEVVESLGQPRAWDRLLTERDLRPDRVADHRGSIRYVLERLTTGPSGVFRVNAEGRFLDYHGRTGFRNTQDLFWFTEEALRRGIAWYCEQIYRNNGTVVGRFRIIRTISTSSGLTVEKEAMGS